MMPDAVILVKRINNEVSKLKYRKKEVKYTLQNANDKLRNLGSVNSKSAAKHLCEVALYFDLRCAFLPHMREGFPTEWGDFSERKKHLLAVSYLATHARRYSSILQSLEAPRLQRTVIQPRANEWVPPLEARNP